MHQPDPRGASDEDAVRLDLADAYAELQRLVLAATEVVAFLDGLVGLAAEVVPGSHAGIILQHDHHDDQVAGSDAVALRMDETRYLRGRGPSLQALRTSQRVHVVDVSVEERWAGYSAYALGNGVRCVVALPLVDRETRGVLSLFGESVGCFTDVDLARAQAFAQQAAVALTIVERQASHLALDEQLREAVASRAIIDQALGILMYAEQIDSHQAFEVLRRASQSSNRKLRFVAADLIRSMTGHAPRPPRPLTDRQHPPGRERPQGP